ncbi:uncharacterized protein LOC142224479 [Haematobia irritans]|uniref:uncharacterized protein LOC142224479 n=1 Tax=Haematobia irritans TaxID=7368 RepID=UPI003F508A08
MYTPRGSGFALQTLLHIIVIIDFAIALRDVRVQIPHAVRRGERAILKCLYDLEGDSLYSVKWYKGRREFYSFTPKESPAMKVFQFTGIGVRVDRTQSNESQLVLESVNAAATGKYSCEVSADAPSFHTLIGAGEMEIVVVPGKDPVITGIRSRYKVGDIIRGNCTSGHSRPGANITWNVNGYEINPVHVKHYNTVKDAREMETVTSGIHFVIAPSHFSHGKLKIRCTAHIHDVYWKSTEKSVEESRHTKHGDNANVVQTFSEDYFDMEDDNVIDRSDTYMTHIKGDVSSLNASGGSSTLHACLSCFWPRLTALSLLLYHGVQKLLQLSFFGQETINGKISNCLAFNGEITSANNGYCKSNSNNNNDGPQQYRRQRNKLQSLRRTSLETQQKFNSKNKQRDQQPKTEHVQLKQQRPTISGTISSQVATICDKEQTDDKISSLRETFFQIKLINNKRAQLQLQLQNYQQHDQRQQHQSQYHHKLHDDHIFKVEQHHHHHPLKQLQSYEHQHHKRQEHQVACDKTVYESYNLTITIQMANIFNVATGVSMTSTVSITTNVAHYHTPRAAGIATVSPFWHKQRADINRILCVMQQRQQKQQTQYICYPPTKHIEYINVALATTSIFTTSNEFFHIMSKTLFIAKTIALTVMVGISKLQANVFAASIAIRETI